MHFCGCLFVYHFFVFVENISFEKNTYFSGLSWENQPQTPPMFWLGVSELGRGVTRSRGGPATGRCGDTHR